MSEEILIALAQLYGIITKQDGGVTIKERDYVLSSFRQKIDEEAVPVFMEIYDEYAGFSHFETVHHDFDQVAIVNRITVRESVLTLSICNKINKILTQKQKIVLVLELYELVKADQKFTAQRMSVIDTVSIAFNIDYDDIKTLEKFVLNDCASGMVHPNIWTINKQGIGQHEKSENADPCSEAIFCFAFFKNANLFLFKFEGPEHVFLNGKEIEKNAIHLFPQGAAIKASSGASFYFSDLQSQFRNQKKISAITLNVVHVDYQFSKDTYGLRDICISEKTGTLVGIMGSSGAGKTTLLDVLSGIVPPSSGKITLNGIDINSEPEKTKGLIGYISQDDLLIEALTVYENLFYHALLSFKKLSEAKVKLLVNKTLDNLGLSGIQHLTVGNIFNKKISGGQRKRLNIALELIREPSVLFVDEPTSGLSSRDSENVIDLLKELTLKGKLIFVVIHQPSSDVFKMFDKFLILDNGGYPIFYGPPVEVVTYLKRIARQVDRDHGQCGFCGNLNPEQIFNIVEEKVVDEFGNPTEKRKKTPLQWNAHYKKTFSPTFQEIVTELPSVKIDIPTRLKQWWIFTVRDLLTKWNDKQYLIVNLLEAPLLAFFLAMVIRYKNDPSLTKYLFRYNENLPAYLLMSIVVAIFLGLSVSAEEIIRDKKIKKRESFLHLSRSSYLLSKLGILFTLSAFQTLVFVLIGNSILEIKGMTYEYWTILFSIACMANVMGLVISSAFESAVTVYILIPILLIPQMILSGAMFSFDKLNDTLRSQEDIPLMADLTGARWAFEALAVEQFKNNEYEKKFYQIEQIENISNFHLVYLLPELKSKLWFIENHLNSGNPLIQVKVKKCFQILSNEFTKQIQIDSSIHPSVLTALNNQEFSPSIKHESHLYIEQLFHIYRTIFRNSAGKKEKLINELERSAPDHLNQLKNNYFNESLSDLVRNIHAKNRIAEQDDMLNPKTEMIFFNPINVKNHLDYRSHFFSPEKHIFGIALNTFVFNLSMIWAISGIMYVALYSNILLRIVEFFRTTKVMRG